MLRLGPPYYQIAGVTVAGDAHDPLQFYYFPNRPHLAVDEEGRPAIRFLILKDALDAIQAGGDDDPGAGRDTEDVAGFMVFDADLSWPEATLRRVEQELRREVDLERDQEIRLAPLPFRDGSVRLSFLDRTTRPPRDDEVETDANGRPVADPPPVDAWVPFLSTSGIPSLYGSNRSIFNVQLSRKATKMLFGSFEGTLPAGVVYDLSYVGMQRAYNVNVSADWERVYNFVQERFTGDFIVFSTEVDKVVEEMIDEQLIKIEASLEVAGEEAADIQEEFNQVRRDLQDLVLDSFFDPAPDPAEDGEGGGQGGIPREERDSEDPMISTARAVRNLINHAGGVGYTKRDVSITDIRRLQADYTVNRAATRRIAPQAHLSLFFEDYSLTRDDVVTVVDGDDDFWRQAEFEVSAVADFAGGGIAKIAVDVQYTNSLDPNADSETTPEAVWSFQFDNGEQTFRRRTWFDPDIGTAFYYRYKIFFDPNAVAGPGTAFETGWRRHDGPKLVINAQELYGRESGTVQTAANFPFDRYPEVYVKLRYQDPETSWMFDKAGKMDDRNRALTFAYRTRASALAPPDMQLTFLRSDNQVIETGWEPLDSELAVIPNPDPAKLRINILVGGDRSKVMNLIVNLRYEDPDNGIYETGEILIDPSNVNQIHTWEVPWKDPTKRVYSYSQTLFTSDGELLTTGFQKTEKRTLPVGDVYVRQLEVQPEMIGPPFANHRVEKAILKLRYEDQANGVLNEAERELYQPQKVAPWRVNLKDPNLRDYTHETVFVFNTGFTASTGPISSRDNLLVISSVPPDA